MKNKYTRKNFIKAGITVFVCIALIATSFSSATSSALNSYNPFADTKFNTLRFRSKLWSFFILQRISFFNFSYKNYYTRCTITRFQ